MESNLYGMALGADGNLYVADAGGNALYRVNPRTGELTVATVFAGLPTSRANPNRGGKNELDPAPTGASTSACCPAGRPRRARRKWSAWPPVVRSATRRPA